MKDFLQFVGECLCWHEWIIVRDAANPHMQCIHCPKRTAGWALKR